MNRCYYCDSPVQEGLDFGAQPITNRYIYDRNAQEYMHPLSVGVCSVCDLVQLTDPFPAEQLTPKYDWITYNEPEGHLDDLVKRLGSLTNINSASTIGGITYKDDTTLARFRESGFNNVWRIDLESELGMKNKRGGLETVQSLLTRDTARKIAQKRGKSDLIVVRHILEHAYDPRQFLDALRQLLRPDGYLVFEVPDSTEIFQTFDYPSIWEEHLVYFTPLTFKNCFRYGGLTLNEFILYPYPHENSMVGITQLRSDGQAGTAISSMEKTEEDRAGRFFASYSKYQLKYKYILEQYKAQGKQVALFGAGHIGATFINLMGLAEHVNFVIDDHPHKMGMYMPGSRVPIYGSDHLKNMSSGLCLSCLSPESEDKVAEKLGSNIEEGMEFASIFYSSKRSLRKN